MHAYVRNYWTYFGKDLRGNVDVDLAIVYTRSYRGICNMTSQISISKQPVLHANRFLDYAPSFPGYLYTSRPIFRPRVYMPTRFATSAVGKIDALLSTLLLLLAYRAAWPGCRCMQEPIMHRVLDSMGGRAALRTPRRGPCSDPVTNDLGWYKKCGTVLLQSQGPHLVIHRSPARWSPSSSSSLRSSPSPLRSLWPGT